MTRLYDWNPMPHVLAVRCRVCTGQASFTFATLVPVRLRRDLEFFDNSSLFERRTVETAHGARRHVALFFPGLHGGTGAIRSLPPGYRPDDWAHPVYNVRTVADIGSVACRACATARSVTLEWPRDAHFQIEYRGAVLWAWNRESAAELRAFIASGDRDEGRFRFSALLRHVPTEFKVAKARATVVKRLDTLLTDSR